MNISARNILSGTVDSVTVGMVSTEVALTLVGGACIVSTVTNASATRLGLAPGKPVTALVKANSVVVALAGSKVQLSARNLLIGKVAHVRSAPVSSMVGITLAGGPMVHALVTHDAIADLGLEVGTDVVAAVKASSVVLAVSS